MADDQLPPGFAVVPPQGGAGDLPPGFQVQPPPQGSGSSGGGVMDFIKQLAQSGGRMAMHALPTSIMADGTSAAMNLGADALGMKRPFPVLPSQALDQGLEPVLGKTPGGIGGAAEAVGSGILGGKLPIPGAGAADAVSSVVSPVTRNQQLATLAKNGVRLDNSQTVGGKLALTAKNFANDGPFGSAQGFTDAQHGDFTKATLTHMGVNDQREATPAVMAAGKQALKDAYDAIAKRTTLTLDGPLATDLDAIDQNVRSSLTSENAAVIQGKIKELINMMAENKSVLSGTQYQKFQQSLGDIAKDGGKAPFVTQLRQAVTGMMDRQADPMDKLLLQQTNQRYGAMKSIEKSITPQNTVSPSLLYNAMDNAKGAGQMVYGQGPNSALTDLAQAGKAILGTNTPNSGSGQRIAGMTALTSAGGALTALALGHYDTAAELATAATSAGMAQTLAYKLAYNPSGAKVLQAWAKSKLAAGGVAQAAMPTNIPGALAGAAQSVQSQQQ